MTIEYKTLRILFEVPEPDAGGGGGGGDGDGNDWLRMEQVEYETPPASEFNSYVDALSRGLAIVTMADLLGKYNSACDENSCLEVEIQVHKSRGDLDYNITASWGILSGRRVSSSAKTTSHTVRMEDSIDLDVLVTGDVTAVWEGEVVAEDGSFLNPKPAIEVDGSVLSFGQKVAGTIRLSYTEQHDSYILSIEPREVADSDPDNTASAYQSTVVAVWSGGVEILEIDLPAMEGNCDGGGGGIVAIDPDDDDEERCIRLIEVRDPCPPNDLISSREEQIECPKETEEESS